MSAGHDAARLKYRYATCGRSGEAVAGMEENGYNGAMIREQVRIGAVVLAGGKIPASLAHLATQRALLRAGGELLLTPLLAALHATPSVCATVVVAPADALRELAVLPGQLAAAGDSLVENMRLGATTLAASAPTHLLFITGDIPLVTPAGIADYIDRSLHSGAALTYPIIPREVCAARFPGARRTYVRIREGTFTGGNAIFTTARLLDDQQALIQGLYTARKSPLQLARLLGFMTVLRMLTGTLTLPYLEQVASRLLHAPVAAVITPYAEIGFDVDKLSDLDAVERALA